MVELTELQMNIVVIAATIYVVMAVLLSLFSLAVHRVTNKKMGLVTILFFIFSPVLFVRELFIIWEEKRSLK